MAFVTGDDALTVAHTQHTAVQYSDFPILECKSYTILCIDSGIGLYAGGGDTLYVRPENHGSKVQCIYSQVEQSPACQCRLAEALTVADWVTQIGG